MLRTFCLGKIHRATVTDANLDYIGSITIDETLVDAAGFFAGQMVKINNLRNGMPWETYIVKGEEGLGEVCLNGPPAHHFKKGDLVIILGYGMVDYEEDTEPTVVFVDNQNQIIEIKRGTHW